MATPEEIERLREKIKLQLESNELDKFSRDLYRNALADLDKRNASEKDYQDLLKKTKIDLDAASRSADYVAESFFDSVKALTKGNKILQEQKQNLNKLTRTARDLLDIRSGEVAVNDKILKKKREEIRLGKRNLEFLREQALKEKDLKTAEALADQIKSVTELEGAYKQIQDTVDKTNKSLGAIPALAAGVDSALQKAGLPALGLADALEKTHMAAQEAEQMGGDAAKQFSAMAEFGGNVKDNLVEALTPANLIQFALVEIVSAMISIDEQTGKIAKNFGISYNQAAGINEEMTDVAASSYLLSITTNDLGDALIKLNNEFGTFAALSEESLESFSRLTEEAGLTEEAALGLYKTTFLTGKTLEETSSEVLGQVAAFNAMNGTAFNQKEIMEDIAKISAATTLSLGGSTDELAKAVLSAKALGVEMSKLEQIADGLLQFESSITSELEAELLIGRDLNLERARLLALNNDIAGVAEEISSQVGSAAEFTQMNRIQQEALAKAVGMTRDGLADALMQQEAFNQLSGVAGDTAKERFDNLVKEVGLEEAKKRLGDENLANMFASENVQERFTQSVEKLKEVFVTVGEVLMPIAEVLADMLGGIAKFVGFFSPAIKLATQFYVILKAITATKALYVKLTERGYIKMKAAQALQKIGLLNDKRANLFKSRYIHFQNVETGKRKLNLGLQNASLTTALKNNTAKVLEGLQEKKNLATIQLKNFFQKMEIRTKLKSIALSIRDGVISAANLAKEIARAAAAAARNAFATVGVGVPIALAAAAAGVAGIYALTKKKTAIADDFMATGYGERGYFDKDSVTLLNNKDQTFIAGTSLNKGAPMASANAQQVATNNELRKQNALLERILNKDSNVYMDSDRVGTAFAKSATI